MVQRILIVEGIWTFRFYYYLTLLVMAGLCLLLIADSIIDVVTGALFFTGD